MASPSDAAARDPLEQHVDRRLQVDDQVGLRRVDGELRIHLLVERELLGVERQARKQAVLVEQVVGHAHGANRSAWRSARHLLRALEQEVELRRKAAARGLR